MKEVDLVRVTVPNHPKTRALTPEGYYDFSRGNTGELAHNNWIHCRIFMLGTEQQYARVYDAFKHTDPFARLGWTVKDSCPTSSIYRWTYAVQPMYDYHHKSDCYGLNFECLKQPPREFVQYISDMCSHLPTRLTWTKNIIEESEDFNFNVGGSDTNREKENGSKEEANFVRGYN